MQFSCLSQEHRRAGSPGSWFLVAATWCETLLFFFCFFLFRVCFPPSPGFRAVSELWPVGIRLNGVFKLAKVF